MKNQNNTIDTSFINESLYEAAKNAQNFIRNISDGKLLREIPKISKSDIKVSVVIPVYNSINTIKRAILSVQNQNFSDLEIILVNDFSKDNTLDIIVEMQKEDQRIKIINNKKNMGILYTRCIGTLSAEGKYIFPLDNDDMFLNYDVIDIVYNKIRETDYDIVYFRGISVWHFHDFLNQKNLFHFRSYTENKIMVHPELGDYAIKRFVLWAQCIKSEVYKKAIDSYGEKRYSKFVTFYEDAIIHFIITQIAQSAKLFLKYGILHIDKPTSTSRKINIINKKSYELYFIETLFEFSRKTSKGKEIAINKINNIFEDNNLVNLLSYKDYKLNLQSLMKKILNESLAHKKI